MIDFYKTQYSLSNVITDSNKLIMNVNFNKDKHPIMSIYSELFTKQLMKSKIMKGFVKPVVKKLKENEDDQEKNDDEKNDDEKKKAKISKTIISKKLPDATMDVDQVTQLNKE